MPQLPERGEAPAHPRGLAQTLLVLTSNIRVADEGDGGLTTRPTTGYYGPNNQVSRALRQQPRLVARTFEGGPDVNESTCSPSPGGGRS